MRGSTALTPPHGPSPDGSSRWRVLALAGLVLATVVALVVLVVVYLQRTDDTQGSFADRAQAVLSGDDPVGDERVAVTGQARQFMLRLNTYGPDLLDEEGRMPEYRTLVEEVITPKFQASFEQGVVAAEQTVSGAGLARTTEVFAAGASALDADSARVLVAGSFVNSYPTPGGRGGQARVEDEPAPFRVEVSLVRTGGEWLVDDFVPVTGEETEEPQQLPSDPAQIPSELPLPGGGNGGGGNGGAR